MFPGRMKKNLPIALTMPVSLSPAMRLLSFVSVSNPETGKSENVQALWDTGAALTVLARSVAENLGLEPVGNATLVSAFGSGHIDMALASVIICVGGMPVQSYVGVIDDRYRTDPSVHITIGLDFISLGDFAVSHDDDGFPIFSFSYPPAIKIDFQEMSGKLGIEVASKDFSSSNKKNLH